MRICLICNEYPPGPHGGIGTFTLVLARGLAAAGHAVRVVGVYPPDHPAADYEEDQGVQVWRMRAPRTRWGWIHARYRLYRTIARWSKAGKIDVVELPDWEGWAAGWPRLPVPVVVRLNGTASYFADELGRSLKRTAFLLERASLRRADYWCSVSRYTADKTQRLFGLRCGPRSILYNPVEEPDEQAGNGRSHTRVVFTGTLTSKKGILSLIEAWPRVLQSCGEAELHVFGKDGRTDDGESMRAYLGRRINGEVGKSVHLHGHVAREQLFEALQTARLAVFPSYAEAFALAPLEAMIRGCPTVYSRRGSGPELIDHGRNGLLVDPDRPEEIAGAIVRVLQDDGLARELGQVGRDRVRRRFCISRVLEENESFYRDCIHDFHATAGTPCSPA